MSIFKTSGALARLPALLLALLALAAGPALACQQVVPVSYQVKEETRNQIDLLVNASRNIDFDFKISNVFVQNPEVLNATAPSPNEIRITGLKPGVSSLTVENEAGDQQILVVSVTADIRRLQTALKTFFPDCSIKILALNEGVILGGSVAQTDQVEKIVAVAEDYFPTVINQLKVDGPQLVAIKVRVYEVSRTKLRKLGVDWANLGGNVTATSSVAGLLSNFDAGQPLNGGQNMAFVIGSTNPFVALLRALEEHNVAKLLDEPTLVTQHGRPASFLSGGKVPFQQAAGLGATSVKFEPFGTQLDVVPLVHGYGELTLDVRAEVSKLAQDLRDEFNNPGFRTRSVSTAVRMRAGHTLALAGNYREEQSTRKKGIPKLMRSPIWGVFFRDIEDNVNETELVFVLTPRFISDVDPVNASKVGVGQLTTSPSNHELYINGHVEVPKCQDDCPTNDRFDDPATRYAPQIQPALEEAIQQPSANLPGSGYLPEPQLQLMPIPAEPSPSLVPDSQEQPDDSTDESARRAPLPAAGRSGIEYNFRGDLPGTTKLAGDPR
ncbi:MAG: pilus assembly protein N-terminal domain-containing protein [Planctomycetota bacterium]|nr:pilus assembly protein N-terminal domain-containing protein [Planctomycetota bacterium]